MIARSLVYYFLETVVGRSEMQMLKRRGARTYLCGTVFLKRRNICQCDAEAAIANQLHDQVDHAPVRQEQQLAGTSCFKCSNKYYERGCLVHNRLLLLHSR